MKIYARNTRFVKVESDTALEFVKSNHTQGLAKPGKNIKSYGLLDTRDELVAVIVFCNPRTAGMQKRYTTELFRLAFARGVRVTGGASKLIKNFIATNPWDFFTYQDTSGEATDVYEHAGMTIKGKANPIKRVLVRDGLTKATAEDNHRDWFSLEQAVRRGPDALIGTKLGEVYREDGSRKSNLDLFLEHGYHLEEIPGDRVYEWRNPNVWFYTYKITSAVDDGCYYIGRHVIHGAAPTEKDCLNDGYMGSGGDKYKNWIKKVGSESLRKSILSIAKTWEKAVRDEKRFIKG